MRHRPQIAGLQYVSVALRQFRQSPLDADIQFVYRRSLRPALIRQMIRHRHPVLAQPKAVGQRIARNLEQPRPRILQVAEILSFAHGLEEHILQDIVSRCRLFQLADQKPAEFRLVAMPGL